MYMPKKKGFSYLAVKKLLDLISRLTHDIL